MKIPAYLSLFYRGFRKTYVSYGKTETKSGKMVTKSDERSPDPIYSKSVCVKAHMGSNPIPSPIYGVGSKITAPFSVEKLSPV